MREVNELAFWFLMALTLTIYSVPLGSRRLRGLIGLILTLCAGWFRYFGPVVRAPIGSDVEFILGMVLALIVIILGLRMALGISRSDDDTKAGKS